LPRFPWARTNRSLRGKVLGARSDLQKSFHDYCTWIAGPVWAELRDWVDPDWFAETEIFDPQKVRYLIQLVKDIKTSKPLYNLMPYERWLWLAAVRRFAEHLEAIKKDVKPPNYENQKCPPVSLAERNGRRKWLRYLVKYAPSIMDAYHKSRRIRQRFRKKRLRRRSIRKFPPLRETS
jgi:hypothetical protein